MLRAKKRIKPDNISEKIRAIVVTPPTGTQQIQAGQKLDELIQAWQVTGAPIAPNDT